MKSVREQKKITFHLLGKEVIAMRKSVGKSIVKTLEVLYNSSRGV